MWEYSAVCGITTWDPSRSRRSLTLTNPVRLRADATAPAHLDGTVPGDFGACSLGSWIGAQRGVISELRLMIYAVASPGLLAKCVQLSAKPGPALPCLVLSQACSTATPSSQPSAPTLQTLPLTLPTPRCSL